MRLSIKLLSAVALCAVASCDVGTTIAGVSGDPALRVVNAFTSPVDVLVDGNVAISAMAAGTISTTFAAPGNHTLVLRPTGSGASVSQSITSAVGALSTIAVVRSASGDLSSAVLDDTNSVVPDGATKVRVLHLAPNAGTLQVYRTQPDFHTPISWQFPFNYQPEPTSLSAPFFQSTVGSWEIHVWQTPADPSGWATAPAKVIIPLASGEKATVVILDKPGGGVKIEVI
jgi:hypothetical protein